MMETNERILVFIPCYNCMGQVKRVIDQFTAEVLSLIETVLIINNRSPDETEEVACSHLASRSFDQEKVKVLRNNENYGLGGSHKVAFKYAIDHGYDYAIILHGDDQGLISDIVPLIKSGKHRQFDALLGARFHPKSTLSGYSKFRTFGNKVFNFIFSTILLKPIYDLGAGLNCYKVKLLNDHFYLTFPDDLTFNYCMVMAHSYYKHKVSFFPIHWREEDQLSNVKLFSQAKKVLIMLFKYSILRGNFLKSEIRVRPIEEYDAAIIYE